MGKDLRDVYEEKKTYLEKYVSRNKLSPEQKGLILAAIEFGSAASYCERTHTMNGEDFASEQYKDGLEKVKKLLK